MLDLECHQGKLAMCDPFDLVRFTEAQDGVYQSALAEIRRGAKRGHWMWFVFPQLRGLGRSPMAEVWDQLDRRSTGHCAAARAAAAAPVRRGDRGYVRHLDRVSDGVGCE